MVGGLRHSEGVCVIIIRETKARDGNRGAGFIVIKRQRHMPS